MQHRGKCVAGELRALVGPDVVRLLDGEVAQQVRVDLVGRMTLAGIGFAVQRRNAHLRHERARVQPTGVRRPFAGEDLAQLPHAEKGVFQVQLVGLLGLSRIHSRTI